MSAALVTNAVAAIVENVRATIIFLKQSRVAEQ
jgi:hypothetical protein